MGNYLSREEILGSPIPTRDVEAFGGTVLVRAMDAKLMNDLMKLGTVSSDGTTALNAGEFDFVMIAQRCMVDPESFEPLFSHADVQALSLKAWDDIFAVASAALELSGMGVEQEEGSPNQE